MVGDFFKFTDGGSISELGIALFVIEKVKSLAVRRPMYITNFAVKSIRQNTRPADLSDFAFDMGIIEEPRPLGLTPSAAMAATWVA